MDAAEPGEVKEPLPTDKSELISLLQSHRRILEVCQTLRNTIDPNDDHYVAQIELASAGVIPALFNVLDTEDSIQLREICETVSTLCANIDNVSVRKRSGLETGFFERSFNPVQDELAEVDGIRRLVELLDSKAEGIKDIAIQTISTCCSFNHSNTLSYLRCLVHDVLDKKYDRLEFIYGLLPDIEVREDTMVLLNQLMLPVLQLVKESNHSIKKEALGVMGAVSAKHPASAVQCCILMHLLFLNSGILVRRSNGDADESLRPRAVHALWQLVHKEKGLLHPESNALGCDGLNLLEPLVRVIGWTKDGAEAIPDEQDDDYSDEALLLLKALAEQNEDVRDKLGGTAGSYNSRCPVM